MTDTTIVNLALQVIGRDFPMSPAAVGRVWIAFLVSLAVFIPASGWLGDRFGGKRVLLTAIAIFCVACALCGLASRPGELVAFRVLQGAGGGMLAPAGMAMLFPGLPPRRTHPGIFDPHRAGHPGAGHVSASSSTRTTDAYAVDFLAILKPDMPKLGGWGERALGFFHLGTGFWLM